MANRSVQESEEFAKNWQIDAISKQVEDNEQNRKTDTEEIKTLIKDVDGKISNLPSQFVTRQELQLEIQKIHQLYAPMRKGFWWFAGAIGALIITYAFQLFVNLGKLSGQ